MADGLSIAASVAGLVSLGFQVCSGITTYLDGLKCREEELESARKYEQSLKASIQTIDKFLSRPKFHHQNSSTDITECIQPCKDELIALKVLVAGLCGEKKNNPSWLDRAKASKKRLTYAFDRPKLSQLQAKVGQAIQSLQLALQILGLESSSSLGHTLQTIEITSNVTVAEIVGARADVTALANNVSTLGNEGPLIRAAVENIGPSLVGLGQLAAQSVQGMQVMREDASLANHMLATKMELMINQLAALQSQSTINQHATTKLLQLAQQDNDDVYSEKHFPTCQFWQGTRPAERKWGLRQAGIGWLADKAIEITFSCKFGSGGASFSPNFTYYPTVDEDIAPGFQLVQIMSKAVDDLYIQDDFNVCHCQCLLEKGFEQLGMLFREGRISPNDMNDRNQTLIYPLSELIWSLLLFFGDRPRLKRIILDFVNGITRFEIPSNIYDTDGQCQSTLIRGLKDRRNKLKQLALKHLPDCDTITFIYLRSGRVLDAQTAVILGLPEAKGVHIPPSLRLTQHQKTDTSNGFPGRSVYHVINDRSYAELFWSHGFWDIDEFTGHFDEVRGDGLPPIATCTRSALIMWFFNRGVNLFRELRPLGGGIDRKSLYVRTAHFNEYKEAVRYFTFTALDMSHTCHHKPEYPVEYTFTCSTTIEMRENARHIQDEQADMIELLEEILFDLEAKLDGMMDDDVDFSMETFFMNHWLVRVEKELKAISGHKLPEDLKRNTEALGVVWDEAAEGKDTESEDERGRPLQYWLDAIDRAAQL
ncbi:hypothetical protein E8E14_008803 [Neopestalotiopsis sp. 37M]|nr:hypothetical protein E8E14_008803 [Neopestalotiopsis sp. 37M]